MKEEQSTREKRKVGEWKGRGGCTRIARCGGAAVEFQPTPDAVSGLSAELRRLSRLAMVRMAPQSCFARLQTGMLRTLPLTTLIVACGCTAIAPRKDALVVSASKSTSDFPRDSADALTAMLTYSAAYVRAIGANNRYFIQDVVFNQDALGFTEYQISESPGGSSLGRTMWVVPYSALRKSKLAITGEDSGFNRHGELRIISEDKHAFGYSTEFSTATVPLGPGPHLKLTRDVGTKPQLSLMFFSRGRAEAFRDALIAALGMQKPNEAPR